MAEFLRRAEEKYGSTTVKVEVDDKDKKPVILLHQGADAIAFEVADWPVIKDAIDRCVAFVGDHPEADA